MSKYIIYGLVDSVTNEIRYIGKSTSGLSRPNDHLKPKNYLNENNYKAHWIKKSIEEGNIPSIIILTSTENKEELNQLEMDLIAKYRAAGARLTNLTDGGEGSVGWVPSEETKKNISEARKKYYENKTTPNVAPNKKEHIFIEGIESKHCPTCESIKPITEFGSHKSHWDKLHHICKVCNAANTAKYRAANSKPKLTQEQLKQSYQSRKTAMSEGLRKAHSEDPLLAKRISIRNSKAIEGTNIETGEKIYFNSALEAKEAGFQNSNLGQAIRANKPYRGYIWRFI